MKRIVELLDGYIKGRLVEIHIQVNGWITEVEIWKYWCIADTDTKV